MAEERTLFFASLNTETNTFSSIPTTEQEFERAGVRRGSEVLQDPNPSTQALLAACRERGFSVIPGLCAQAAPGAPVRQELFEKYVGMILNDLRASGPVDAVLLCLHGAMIAEGCLDCEGELLARVRHIVGASVPIGAMLDPHAHLTEAMVAHASILVFMKEYPHTDGMERIEDVLCVLSGMLAGAPRPQAAVYDCRTIGFFPTHASPMREFVDGMSAREGKEGVLSISFVHGFPWGDTPDTGAKVLVYTQDDPAAAARIAEQIHQEFWAIRDVVEAESMSLEDALEAVAGAEQFPLVLADIADNPGGGAPSDATFMLRGVLEAGLDGVGFGLFYDPEAVAACFAAGKGAKLRLQIGGKHGAVSGEPVSLDVEVMGLAQQAQMDVQGLATFAMGDVAWVNGSGIDIVLNTVRVQLYDPSALRVVGLVPEQLKAIVVKSSNHFRIGFGAMAKQILVVTSPGALDFNFSRLPYRRLQKPFYPKVANPFEEL